ncbi:hypothetical protein [Candidatus Neoehrlichia procyonis]|uniref:Uncharacterized protein n=1 Tax=Candidatus Neoehrlichia procyonis str. RAC413 TaxID=1359163 RepID=A0A0F3NL76_9RICK|nr:hypothetical protein [Candidatus Neoehrlichia lotoris]KJV68813.1 hypothetical protein NLO413_0178 [Candidatus Neoehrlichia lotoris str. RAC413]
MKKKVLNIAALILALFSIYLLVRFFIKSQFQQQLDNFKLYINPYTQFTYDNISLKGFSTQNIYIKNVKIKIQSLDIIFSILLTYDILNNSINIKIIDNLLTIQDSSNVTIACNVDAQYYMKLSHNLLLQLLKLNNFFGLIKIPQKHDNYPINITYKDNGIVCNNTLIMKKNFFQIITNRQKSNTNFKVNTDINDNINQSFIIKDLDINTNNNFAIKDHYLKVNIPNITLYTQYFSIFVNGNVSFPQFDLLINNKFFIYDGQITFTLKNYKNALKFLFEQINSTILHNSNTPLLPYHLENTYKILYEAANIKDNNNITITLKGDTNNNSLLIGLIPYEKFLEKVLTNISNNNILEHNKS